MPGDFNYAILRDVAHRPWAMPSRPWVMTQTWHDLLFAHWRVAPDALRPLVPDVFALDLFQGHAWVGVVPFRMTNVMPRGLPAVSWISEFPELNVRTYVVVGDQPGVYFFSLDAGSAIAAEAARRFLNLPYFSASMTVSRKADGIEYASWREGAGPPAEFAAVYGPTGANQPPHSGTLEYFLTERYCLYHVSKRGRPYRLDIHHPPWPLQPARATLTTNTMAAASRIALPDESPLLHYVRRQDMVAWPPETLPR